MSIKVLHEETIEALKQALSDLGFGAADWSCSTIQHPHALLDQLPKSKFNLQLHMGEATVEGGVFVPTSIKSFLLHAAAPLARPVLVIPSLLLLLSSPAGTDLETLAMLARTCFFASCEAFELLEIHCAQAAVLPEVALQIVRLLSSSTSKPLPQQHSWLIEALRTSHGDALPAGTCVALGCVKEAEVARALQICNPASVGRLSRLLKSLGLPSKLPPKLVDPLAWRLALAASPASASAIQLPTSDFTYETKTEVPFALVERCVAHNLVVRQFELSPATQRCEVRVPGSKSVSNRALLLAGLSSNPCVIYGLLHSDDTQVMMGCLEQFGARFTWSDAGTALLVHGNGGKFAKPTKPLWMGNAGTATRFVISLCALVADAEWTTVMEGSARMMERPQSDLTDALKKNGVQIEGSGKGGGYLPLRVRGGGFQGGQMTMSGKISSQFVSSVLFAAPYAQTALDLTLEEAEPTSISYIEMTVKTMKEFGVEVERLAINRFRVPNNTGGYRSPSKYVVEADASSATYALAMANIVPGRTVKVLGVGKSSVQGDADFCFLLEKMGGQVEQDAESTSITGGAQGVRCPGEVNMANLTDAFLTATAVACLAADGQTTTIVGIANQHQKECDRIAALVTELGGKCGYEMSNLPDGISVRGDPALKLKEGEEVSIHTYDDHRIAMSAAVLATRLPGLVIEDKDCTDKTYPEFWDDLERCLKTGVEAHPKLASVKRMWGDETLVLVGMRGVGKTTLGAAAAAAIDGGAGWRFVDLDAELCKEAGVAACKDIVDSRGWAAFRELECRVLERVLRECPRKHVVSCGGGVVEHANSRAALQAHFPVVNMERDFEEIRAQLEPVVSESKKAKLEAEQQHRPTFGEPLETVWLRREPLFQQCSHYDFFFSLQGSSSEDDEVTPLFLRFLENLRHAITPDNVFAQPGLFRELDLSEKSSCVKRAVWRHRQRFPLQAVLARLPNANGALARALGRSAVDGVELPSGATAVERGELLGAFGPVRVLGGSDKALRAYPGKLPASARAPEEQFYIFGHPTFASNSPTLHNAAFASYGATAEAKYYCIFDTLSFERSRHAMLHNAAFAGASVTIPHKQAFFPCMQQVSEHAQRIGAINTIIKLKTAAGGALVGDNTDWLGIRNVLAKDVRNSSNGAAMIVVGAGGTARAACYCANVMGLQLLVHNRTRSKAEELASEFNGTVLEGDVLPVGVAVACVVSTIPATSQWTAPPAWLADKQTVVLDAAMRPRDTALLVQARQLGLRAVDGIEMFMEQGLEQVKRFKARSIAPEDFEDIPAAVQQDLRRAVMRFYDGGKA